MGAVPEPRTALVTGAGRGIGRAIARRLSDAGLRVALTARNKEELSRTAESCAGDTLVVPTDITDADGVHEAFDEVERSWGPVSVLVASAGGAVSARVERTTDEQWQSMLDLNLTAPFRCIRRAVPGMRAAGYGRIVVVASTAARVGEPYISAYTASKHGVLGLIRSAAAELASTGITVNAVCPGYVDTPMTEASIQNIVATTGRTPQEARQILERKQPIGRLITPEEVGDAVWFCIESGAMSGQAVNVDGGAVQS